MLKMLGKLESNKSQMVNIPDRSKYDFSKYQFLLRAPFNVTAKCCNVMKKAPSHEYYKKTGKKPIIATMADESQLRLQDWLSKGCNAFDSKIPTSKPLSFWTEQDILQYIKQNNLKIASVYGDIVPDMEAINEADGQISINDLLGLPNNYPLKTSGCKRTGCMFCGFGCHLNNDQRFVMMKNTHPKQYDYIMRPADQGGLNYKEIIDWLNENGNLNIKY